MLTIILAVMTAQPEVRLKSMDWPLVKAIAQVESGGKADAVGDGGKAVGILQIHPILVEDCNRILGWQRFTLEDRRNPDKCYGMFQVWVSHYCRSATREEIARRWNGGPNGDLKAATEPYWKKVKAVLRD